MIIQFNVLLRNKSHHYIAWLQSDYFSFFYFSVSKSISGSAEINNGLPMPFLSYFFLE